VHGDLSPNNVVIDLDALRDDPALYLIDFDGFFAATAGANQALTVGEGGTYGTEGYCPPDLAAAANAGDGSAAPYSDRYGRDMLLLEFLLMGRSLSADDPLVHWNREQLQRQFAAWQARSEPKCVRTFNHLDPTTVFNMTEAQRPTSVDLAMGLGLSLPERRFLRRVTELTRPTPAILGSRPTIARMGGSSGKSMAPGQWSKSAKRPIRPFYRKPRLSTRTIWDDDRDTFLALIIGVAISVLVCAMLGAIIRGAGGEPSSIPSLPPSIPGTTK